jgi:hypothetical protein
LGSASISTASAPAHLEPVDAGQADVKEHQVGMLCSDGFEGASAIGRRDRCVSGPFEDEP